MTEQALAGEGKTRVENSIKLRRTGTEEDMAGIILYLVGRAGAYVDGTTVAPDGGRISTIPSFFCAVTDIVVEYHSHKYKSNQARMIVMIFMHHARSRE